MDLETRFPRVDEIPFTAETKRMTTLHDTPEGVVAYAKGAPEIILASCGQQATEGGEWVLDEAGRERILETARQMANQALGVLAVATKSDVTRATASGWSPLCREKGTWSL